jgi:hypothetical protein
MTALTWSQASDITGNAQRLDPEYFDPRVVSVADMLQQQGGRLLGELVSSACRGTSPEYDPLGNTRVIKTANVQHFELSTTPAEYVFKEQSPQQALIPSSSLLITSTGVGSAGRTFAYFGSEGLVADGHVTILPMKCSKVDGAYICAFLQSPVGRQQLIRLHRGSSRQIEIYPEDLLNLFIRWPASKVRSDIGAQWLSGVNAVEDARSCVSAAVSLIENFIGLQAGGWDETSDGAWETTTEVLCGGLRLDPEYGAPSIVKLRATIEAAGGVPLSEASLSIDKGIQPDFYDEEGNTIVIKSKDVNYPDFNLSDCERTFHEGNDCLNSGAVLINMTGEGSLGRATVVPELDEASAPMIAAVDLAVVEVDRQIILPEFLALFLNSWMGLRQTQSLKTGSSRQQHLYAVHFDELFIPVRRNADGSSDLTWQQKVVALAKQRSSASQAAIEMSDRLDRWFMEDVGIAVDLTTIPH